MNTGCLTREMLERAFIKMTDDINQCGPRGFFHYCHPIELPFWEKFYSGQPYDVSTWFRLKNECVRKWRMNHRNPKWTIAYLQEQYRQKLSPC